MPSGKEHYQELEKEIDEFARRLAGQTWSDTVSREYRRLERALLDLDETTGEAGEHSRRLRRRLDELSEFGRASGTY